jgi:hypothetical protein
MNEAKSSWTTKLPTILGIGCLLTILTFYLDQPAHPVGNYSGVIVGTFPPGKWRTGMETIQVKLTNGNSVIARISVPQGFPYQNGTVVTVTVWESLFFRKRSYEARVQAVLPGP